MISDFHDVVWAFIPIQTRYGSPRFALKKWYHTAFMNQVKQGSKTIDLFQASLAKKHRPKKGLDSPTPGSNDQSYSTSSSEISKSHYRHSDEKSSDKCALSK